MDSDNDIVSIFNTERDKLFSVVDAGLVNPELPLSGIIKTYYQVINVSSLCTMLSQQSGDSAEHQLLTDKIKKTQKFISDKFNSDLHCTITKHLANSVASITKDLQSSNIAHRSKENIESEAKLYEQLRKTMSTKEFVEQYGQGLQSDD